MLRPSRILRFHSAAQYSAQLLDILRRLEQQRELEEQLGEAAAEGDCIIC